MALKGEGLPSGVMSETKFLFNEASPGKGDTACLSINSTVSHPTPSLRKQLLNFCLLWTRFDVITDGKHPPSPCFH